jgi:hypothetical protein
MLQWEKDASRSECCQQIRQQECITGQIGPDTERPTLKGG